MTVNAIDKSQQRAARVAGLSFLLSLFAVAAASFGVFFQVIVPGDAVESAQRILANERLFRLYLSGLDEYYVGLLFWALALTIGSYLWFTSKYIPRSLAVFGLMSSVWCVFCTLVYYIFPSFAEVLNWWFDTPMVLFELALSVWLLVKGVPYGAAYSVTNRSIAGQFVNS